MSDKKKDWIQIISLLIGWLAFVSMQAPSLMFNFEYGSSGDKWLAFCFVSFDIALAFAVSLVAYKRLNGVQRTIAGVWSVPLFAICLMTSSSYRVAITESDKIAESKSNITGLRADLSSAISDRDKAITVRDNNVGHYSIHDAKVDKNNARIDELRSQIKSSTNSALHFQEVIYTKMSDSFGINKTKAEVISGWLFSFTMVISLVLLVYFNVALHQLKPAKKQNSGKTQKAEKPTGTEPTKKSSVKTDSKKPKTTAKKNAPELKLVKSNSSDAKLELARKWVSSTSQKINVTNLMSHMTKRKEGVSNMKARDYLKSMCDGEEPLLKRTSSAANAGFVRVREIRRVV